MRAGTTTFGVLLVAATLASAAVCGSALAQEASAEPTSDEGLLPTDCPVAGTVTEQRRAAARLFGEAESESAALRVAGAARAFACSYALVATAQAAYNAGVAYEAIEQDARARHWFERYLEQAPDAEDRAEVMGRVAALTTRIAEREAREQAAREAAARDDDAIRAEAAAAAAATAESEARARARAAPVEPAGLGTLGFVGVIAGSAGVAAAGIGVALYVVSGGLHDDFVAGGRTNLSLASRGETLDLAASSLWIAGGAVALGGAALALFDLLGARTERAPVTARLMPYLAPRAGAGAECGLAGAF
jgi:hypothetical protein